ncbi:MAG: DUF4153 domain-containing protein [Bacteroidales bacterium]|nr:DUF4153 domain-containing protein [Bacteroidales bacterium]
MKAFDFSYLLRKTIKTFWRFPIPVILILLSFFSTVILIYKENEASIWQHLLLTSVLGIPLFVAFNLYLERVETRRWFNIIINAIGFLFLILFFINLPSKQIFEKHYIRAFILFLTFLASMFYLPFIGFHQQMPFWYYNKQFIKRILISFFFSTIIYLGLLFAILAIDVLFGVNINYKYYLYISAFSYMLLLPWLILGGLQLKFTYHANKQFYPKEVRTFALYVLLPLNLIYGIILFVYSIKIIISGIWPSGWTVGLIMGYSIIHLLIIVLTFPVLFDKENKILVKYVFINFIFIVLFLVMYFLAIFKRIQEYGLTEHRVIVILFGIWMLFLSIYLFIKKIQDLRVIPFSFIILAFLSVSGPWNMFRICKKQQIKRWEYLLVKNDLLQQGKINAFEKNVDPKTQTDLSSIALYLYETHGSNTLKPYFKVNIDSLFNNSKSNYINYYDKMSELFSSVGLTFNPYYFANKYSSNYEFYTNDVNSSLKVDSSLFICFLNVYSNNEVIAYKQNFQLNDSLNLELSLQKKTGCLLIKLNNKLETILNLHAFVNELNKYTPLSKHSNSINLKSEHLRKEIFGSTYRYEFILNRMEYDIENKTNIPISFSGYLLIKDKP